MDATSIDEDETSFEALDAQMRLVHLYKLGDIILVRDGKKPLSRSYQWLCRSFLRPHSRVKWHAIPSHALIAVGPGLYLEAMPKSGVYLVKAEQYRPSQFSHFKVLRHANADAFVEQLDEAATWHFGQAYNYKINLTWWRRKFHSHSYCSQLVSSIYERAQKKLPGKPPNLALPIDLAKLEFHPDWKDITSDYLKADQLLAQGGDLDLFNSHREFVTWPMEWNYRLADSQKLFHQIHLNTQMLSRRDRIRDSLAFVSPRVARAYHRIFISAGTGSAEDIAAKHLTSQRFVEMLMRRVGDFSGDANMFDRANTWRMEDAKFQGKFEEAKVASAMSFQRRALAFAIACFGLALSMKDGSEERFEKNRNRLLQSATISDDLFAQVRNTLPNKLQAIEKLIKDGDQSAKIWISAIICFMELAVISRCLSSGSKFADYRGNPQMPELGKKWIGIFNSLPPKERKRILKMSEGFFNYILDRPDAGVSQQKS